MRQVTLVAINRKQLEMRYVMMSQSAEVMMQIQAVMQQLHHRDLRPQKQISQKKTHQRQRKAKRRKKQEIRLQQRLRKLLIQHQEPSQIVSRMISKEMKYRILVLPGT